MMRCRQPLPVQRVCLKCYNLLENPSFEAGLSGWETDNVTVVDSGPFEGTQEARMGPGIASMFQEVSLAGTGLCPLLLSFEAFAGFGETSNGDLTAEVLWLDQAHKPIAVGLRLLIPNSRINGIANLTLFAITDRPPARSAWARILFSKATEQDPDNAIDIDQIILTPVNTNNLVQNPGFELGLSFWNYLNTTVKFSQALEGNGAAFFEAGASTLYQDIPLNRGLTNLPLLLSFAAVAFENAALSVQVQWLDSANSPIGLPGLDIFIPESTLEDQENYLAYLDITQPPPAGAVKARIVFNVNSEQGLYLDNVILSRAGSMNLVQNPTFENGLNYWSSENVSIISNLLTAYEGPDLARFSISGAFLFQDIAIPTAEGRCFLLNFGYRSDPPSPGDLRAEVHWLDSQGSEIGLGLSLIIPEPARDNIWLVYTGISEPAPPGTQYARLQFTKSVSGISDSYIEIDKVVFANLVRC